MKTKQLIAELKKFDPKGELEVTCEGAPIFFVEQLPAYYDGDLMIHDKDKGKYTITDKGNKIRLHLIDIYTFCELNPDKTIEIDVSSPNKKYRWERDIDDVKRDLKSF